MSDDEGELFGASSKKRKGGSSSSKSKKAKHDSFIDDSAELSGEEEDEDDEEEEEDDDNEYMKDGFVVDEEEEEEEVRRPRGDLEDSDDEDEDEEDHRRKRSKIRKLRDVQRLDEDDLDLINEARGIKTHREIDAELREREEARVMAQNEAELRKGLFHDDEDAPARHKHKKKVRVERYDEDGMDDFIDDDIGDQGDIMAADHREYEEGGVSEAQLNEASEIFGTDYLAYMQDQGQQEDDGQKGQMDEIGESDVESEDDDDLFGDDDDDPAKAEARRQRREKKASSKAERRRQARLKKAKKQKAELRKNFEPVQLIENFCTERDDEIRMKDAPERFFDWKAPFHGRSEGDGPLTDEEEEQALWIMARVPDIMNEYSSPPIHANVEDREAVIERHQRSVLESIAKALRCMHRDLLEPAFIKRYRADIVTSPSVRENLYKIMDEDEEWNRLLEKRAAVEDLLSKLTADADADEAKGAEENNIKDLKSNLDSAKEKLEEAAKEEQEIKNEISNLGVDDDNGEDNEDDELFGDDDDDGGEKTKKKKEKERLTRHLKTITEMLRDRVERVAQLTAQLQSAEAKNVASLDDQGPSLNITKKTCRSKLWTVQDYEQHLSVLTDERDIDDLKKYLSLIKEGNDAIRKKENPNSETGNAKERKRSRSVSNDFYRSRVAEGLRSIVYRFMLSPIRAGIKLDETVLKGEASVGEDDDDPSQWSAPKIPQNPFAFASELIGSGELVSSQGDIDTQSNDPLSGCRFVAAIEMACEPRVRRVVRYLFRSRAVLTTRPTKKGLDNIDAFHDFYGLHLIKDKPVKDHFPMDDKESETKKFGLGAEEMKELDAEMKRREQESCLQYLRILEAEHFGYIIVHVHLPYLQMGDSWHKERRPVWANRDNQDLQPLMSVLESIYLPLDGDTEEWNEERRKILKFALTKVLLPEFENELRKDLRQAATKIGIAAAGNNLHDLAMEGAYRPASLMGKNRFLFPTGDLPIVGVCCATDAKDATYLAAVTERGEMSDHFPIPSGQRIENPGVREKISSFLMQARPSAVVIGTSGGFTARFLVRRLSEIVTSATEEWNNRFIQRQDEDDDDFERRKLKFRRMGTGAAGYEDDDDDEPWKCNVDLIDDTVPQLFGRSVRGKKEFPEKDVNLKCAIAIARQAKDPLAELTYAWNVASDTGVFGTELLFLNIHPLQKFLPKSRLLRQYERVLCDAVAEVGVDINIACANDHLLGSLSFVAGLGPRKAANLKQNMSRIGGAVASRRGILEKRLMGPIVYNNAVAFLRIREVEQLMNQNLHPLDDTRLHPDVYHRNNWAVKIAIDALERVDDAKDKEAFGIQALTDVIDNSQNEVEKLFKATKREWESHYGPTFDVATWDPRTNVPPDFWKDKVEELDLDAFASMIEQSGVGKWNSHLQMIKWEFRLPYEDPRKPMAPLSGDKLFNLITGETDQTLRPGKEVTGKVVKNGDYGSRVKLEGDIPAFIPLRYMSDEHVKAAEDVLSVGAFVTAVVIEMKKEHFTVDISLRKEETQKPIHMWPRPHSLPVLDLHFDESLAHKIELEKSKEKDARLEALQIRLGGTSLGDGGVRKYAGKISRRACAHPAFRNAKNDEVNKELREGGEDMIGEALIRPSSKNSDSLAIHWVVKANSIKIIEVNEEDKDTDASIGKKLKIKEEIYESIDEILGRFIAPMNDHVELFSSHRKFIDKSEDEVDEMLKEQKKREPAGVFYNLCWMDMHPGYGCIRYITGNNPHHHLVGINPKGYAWGPKVYSDLDRLLNDFKKNPRGSSRSVGSSTSSRSTIRPPPPDRSRWGSRQPPPPPRPPPPIPAGGSDRWGAAPSGYPPRPPNLPPPPSHAGYPPQPPSFPPPSNFQQRPPPPPHMNRPPPPPYR